MNIAYNIFKWVALILTILILIYCGIGMFAEGWDSAYVIAFWGWLSYLQSMFCWHFIAKEK